MLDADGGWCPLGHTDDQVGFRPVLLALGLALDMMADQHFFICVGLPPSQAMVEELQEQLLTLEEQLILCEEAITVWERGVKVSKREL
jgi:hypothetical protein